MQPFVKVFATPGIDSHPSEQGVFNSGAGFDPKAPTAKAGPFDWSNASPTQGPNAGNLIGNFGATKAPNADSLKIRRRGISPWGGKPKNHSSIIARSVGDPGSPGNTYDPQEHLGGIRDMNPGAGSLIAGGPGAASSIARYTIRDKDNKQNMKLPTLPIQATRGGSVPLPSGGGVIGTGPAAPIVSKIPGYTSIFGFVQAGKK